MQLRDADAQVAVRELVGDVEPERPELAPLQHDAVEQAQREQHPLSTDHGNKRLWKLYMPLSVQATSLWNKVKVKVKIIFLLG